MRNLLVFLILLPFMSTAQVGIITTHAGTGVSGYSGDGGPCNIATLNRPQNIASDNLGNLFFADADNDAVRKINLSGIITTVAGSGISGYSGDGGPATDAKLNTPTGICLDIMGNLYIADNTNHVVRKVNTFGIMTTIPGNGINGYSGDSGMATSATFGNPYGVVIDNSGNIYVSDVTNHVVRKINTIGIITTIAGNGTSGYSGDNGPATAAQLKFPTNMAVSTSGDVYIPDWTTHCVRKVNSLGIITTFAGNGSGGNSGDGGSATAAQLSAPQAVNVDNAGNIYISDILGAVVRKVNSAGIITTIAGNGTSGYAGDNGPATAAELNGPSGITFSSLGSMYISEAYGQRIRKVIYSPEEIKKINDANEQINIFPNPTRNEVTITTTEKIENLNIMNMIGQVIITPTTIFNKKDIVLNISHLPAGIYLVKVNGVNGGRFIKQ